jgi:hypothetical protein
MSDQKPVYLVSTAYGGVVTQQADGYPSGVVMERRGIKDDEQKWILEFGEEPDTVALKNVANDKYMSASGENYKPVGTGEKTWWKMWYSDVSTPGAFRLSVASGPDENCIEIQTDQNKKDKVILFTWRVCLLPLCNNAWQGFLANMSSYSKITANAGVRSTSSIAMGVITRPLREVRRKPTMHRPHKRRTSLLSRKPWKSAKLL